MKAWSAAAAATALVAVAAAPAHAQSNNNTVKKLTKAVTADGVLAHLEAFQGIADEFGDRAAGRPGYAASVDYVVEQLEAAGYTPKCRSSSSPTWMRTTQLRRISPEPRTFVDGTDFLRNNFDTGRPKAPRPGRWCRSASCSIRPGPAEQNTQRLRGRRLRRLPGRRDRARAARHLRLRRQGPQCPGRRRGGGDRHERGPAGPHRPRRHDRRRHRAHHPGRLRDLRRGREPRLDAGRHVTVTVDYDPEMRTAYNVIAETSAATTTTS